MSASRLRRCVLLVALAIIAGAPLVYAQGAGEAALTVLPDSPITVQAGKSAAVEMSFRVRQGLHINSNKPLSEVLIPTAVKLSPPAEMLIGKVQYPPGQELAFPFMPDEKLSVYSGTFQVTGLLTTTKSITPGSYRVRGEVKYQACSDRQCFPPHTTPFSFDVKVVRGPGPKRKNPAQSPNVHG